MGVAQISMWSNVACIESYISKAKRRIGSCGEPDVTKVQGDKKALESTKNLQNYLQLSSAALGLVRQFMTVSLAFLSHHSGVMPSYASHRIPGNSLL